ncbi:hypothetical protein H7I77_09380 [Mycolicibacterium novocastrense]|uniref:Lipoprotein n=1 Tax=Mycolicibacterium novocastrense TaxID=59813 RepID=A0AAW5SKC4_MYCNV|nr:hypothetical protein [Mycolicibacterium novocastrense]MCV7023557.1 hypothetical protein [Mycolicibacterium novocastrense]GAT12053.1 uncharacterized protein RMCN_5186 [Mycolicibacterium novocastrense]
MRAVMVVAGLAAAAALAGCASEQPAEQQPTTSQAPAQTTTSQAPAETTTTSETPSGHGSLAQCLDEHGVPAAPGPAAGPPPGVDAETWNRAMQACATFAPGPAG